MELTRQQEINRALDNAEENGSDNRIKTIGDGLKETGQVFKNDIEKNIEMKMKSTEKDINELAGKLKSDTEEAVTGKKSRYDVDMTSNIKNPEPEQEEDFYPGRRNKYMI